MFVPGFEQTGNKITASLLKMGVVFLEKVWS